MGRRKARCVPLHAPAGLLLMCKGHHGLQLEQTPKHANKECARRIGSRGGAGTRGGNARLVLTAMLSARKGM